MGCVAATVPEVAECLGGEGRWRSKAIVVISQSLSRWSGDGKAMANGEWLNGGMVVWSLSSGNGGGTIVKEESQEERVSQ